MMKFPLLGRSAVAPRLIALSFLALTASAFAQTPPAAPSSEEPLLKQTFKESDEGWKAMGMNVKTALSASPAEAGGTLVNALRFDYTIAKGDFGVLVLPVSDGKLSRAKSIRFRVKTDYTTPIAFLLQEKDGGRWSALFTVPVGKWQNVELSPADFVLLQGKDDPADTNKRLDLDRIEYAGLSDIAQLFAQSDNATLTALFGAPKGAHTLYLSDFVVSPSPLPGNSVSTGVVDGFGHPQVGWIGFGSTTLSQVENKPFPGRALQVSYRQAPGKVSGVVRAIGAQTLAASAAGRTHLSLQVASAKPAKLLIQLEEKGGGKYNTVVTLAGESHPKSLSLAFADFTAADDSKDENEHLDLDQVTQIFLIDASGMLDSADDDNTLWIGSLRAETRPVALKGI